jgi:hypothetical protein
MQINQTFEGFLLTGGKQPVDRAFFVGFQVILEKARREIATDGVEAGFVAFRAETCGDEGEVFLQNVLVFAPDGDQEFAQAMSGVVFEPVGFGDRDDAVGIGGKAAIAAGVEAFVAGMGLDQARFVQAVAAHHAADGVGDEFFDRVFAKASGQFVVGEFGAVAVFGVDGEGDLFVRYVRGQFALQAIGFDEQAVVFFFEFLHALGLLVALVAPVDEGLGDSGGF